MSAIVQLYLKKVMRGDIQIDQVPSRWRAEVETELVKIEENKE